MTPKRLFSSLLVAYGMLNKYYTITFIYINTSKIITVKNFTFSLYNKTCFKKSSEYIIILGCFIYLGTCTF